MDKNDVEGSVLPWPPSVRYWGNQKTQLAYLLFTTPPVSSVVITIVHFGLLDCQVFICQPLRLGIHVLSPRLNLPEQPVLKIRLSLRN
jgi:hypothetical protein